MKQFQYIFEEKYKNFCPLYDKPDRTGKVAKCGEYDTECNQLFLWSGHMHKKTFLKDLFNILQ